MHAPAAAPAPLPASSAQLPLVALSAADTVVLEKIELEQTLPISGPIKAVNSAFVKARLAGELQDLLVREGDRVQVGQVIARIDPTEYQARLRQAQQQAQSAKAQVDIAQRSYDNNRSLVDQGFISKTALETSAFTLTASQASFQAAQSGVDVLQKALDDAVMRTPIGGLVAQRLAQNGERIAVDTRVVEIVDLSRLELEASLSPEDAMQVRIGQSAQLRIDGAEQSISARVARVNPSASATNRSLVVYLSVNPHPQLRQGLFAQGSLATGAQTLVALPLSAVRTDKPQPYVQAIVQGKVVHLPAAMGIRGEYQGQTMVALEDMEPGLRVLRGSVGPLLAGTPVNIDEAKK
ncbi:MAG: efflux RND transporter periplasmic adaptor subunit [Betaproteobacteria bacterium]